MQLSDRAKEKLMTHYSVIPHKLRWPAGGEQRAIEQELVEAGLVRIVPVTIDGYSLWGACLTQRGFDVRRKMAEEAVVSGEVE